LKEKTPYRAFWEGRKFFCHTKLQSELAQKKRSFFAKLKFTEMPINLVCELLLRDQMLKKQDLTFVPELGIDDI
jgi:hypothetical protein